MKLSIWKLQIMPKPKEILLFFTFFQNFWISISKIVAISVRDTTVAPSCGNYWNHGLPTSYLTWFKMSWLGESWRTFRSSSYVNYFFIYYLYFFRYIPIYFVLMLHISFWVTFKVSRPLPHIAALGRVRTAQFGRTVRPALNFLPKKQICLKRLRIA